jgi:hypothetical protein
MKTLPAASISAKKLCLVFIAPNKSAPGKKIISLL